MKRAVVTGEATSLQSFFGCVLDGLRTPLITGYTRFDSLTANSPPSAKYRETLVCVGNSAGRPLGGSISRLLTLESCQMIISLDCETTGLDWAHGAMPYLVTTCDQDRIVKFWEWDVDPLTRKPHIPATDLTDILFLIRSADLIYLQNGKFDAHMLYTIGIELPWHNVRDTLCMGHLLASNHDHDLTSMCVEYLGVDIEHYELAIKEVVKACRTIVKRDYPTWRLAKEGEEGMPSVKPNSKNDEDKPWKNDMWLPRALGGVFHHKCSGLPEGWNTACSNYANADSAHTLPLGLEMEHIIRERGLWAIYEHRLRQIRADYDIECAGVTVRGSHTDASIATYEQHIAESEIVLVEIAGEYEHDLELANGAALNDNMRDFFYGSIHEVCPRCDRVKRIKHWNGESISKDQRCPKCLARKAKPGPATVTVNIVQKDNLALPVIGNKKTGNASLDGDALEQYLATTEGDAHDFIEILLDKRKYSTSVGYMEQYRRYWIPTEVEDYYRIHCSLKPFGTDHLRQSSSNPNMQNTSSKDIINTKMCFGPMPEREFWSMDYESIEARIPAYESGEAKLVQIFEHPDEAPYWGNLYYLMASILYPEFYDVVCPKCISNNCSNPDHPLPVSLSTIKTGFKEVYPRLYKQAKFFLLAKQYGAGKAKGDLLSKVKDSYSMVDGDLPLLAALQRRYLSDAVNKGYVQTLPDRGVDPTRGYPLLPSRTEDGRVLSTTPFNYHISGTACWCKNRAMVRCADQCRQWRSNGFDAWIVMEVHDELLFDFPRGDSWETNYERAMELKGLMEQSGVDLIPAIPTPVAVKLHTESWTKGVLVK